MKKAYRKIKKKCPKCQHENPEILKKFEKLFCEMRMDYYIAMTQEVLERINSKR